MTGSAAPGWTDFRRDVQYVFQDPYAALNPARTIGYYLSRPVRNFDGAAGAAVPNGSANCWSRSA